MTIQKLKPCPDCGADAVGIWTYDSGWRRAECDACLYIAEPAQNLVEAARNHNRRVAEGSPQSGPRTRPEIMPTKTTV